MPEELKKIFEEIDAERLEEERKREILLDEEYNKWIKENGID